MPWNMAQFADIFCTKAGTEHHKPPSEILSSEELRHTAAIGPF
jgi:hypothetical protein